MTDEVSNLILERLRRLDNNQEKILKALQDLRQDNASIRGELTSINGAIVRLTERLDLIEERWLNHDQRLDLIERRLDIVDTP